jgi:lipid-A-disaccharide synthase-like uncharacterized protein
MNTESFWLGVGFLGQALFSARFVVQWIASERARRSIVPIAFWFLSLGGGATLLAYALYRRDPVFILGQGSGLLIYLRNLMLVRNDAQGAAVTSPAPPPTPASVGPQGLASTRFPAAKGLR